MSITYTSFRHWELAPADASGDPGPEKFRPDELKCVAAALSDLPAPTGTSTTMPMDTTEYMKRTRGLIIDHLMRKIYEKNDLELETRIQGALDESVFRMVSYCTRKKLHPSNVLYQKYYTAKSLHSSEFETLTDTTCFSFLKHYTLPN